jgi:hypothetical protein
MGGGRPLTSLFFGGLDLDRHLVTSTRRRARNHLRSLKRLGYHVTIQAINPDTGELQAATA